MMAFGEYAKYYDLLYADKDYAAESAFVGEIIHRHPPESSLAATRHGDSTGPTNARERVRAFHRILDERLESRFET
jgi:hypothetical protein